MTGTSYRGLKNTIYTAATRIGAGGEGTVFTVKDNNSLVIKVYTEAPERDKVEKLTFMTTMANADLLRISAWPLDVVRNSSGQVCGIIMKRLVGYVPLHMLFSPMERKRLFPDKGYNFLVHVAKNLSLTFHQIHLLGIIVGDVNEANILVNSAGIVAFIDCDSFQIKNGSRYHYCEVGIPRYTPPELLERGSFENVVRTTNTDAFSLATLIFQLLFLGRAPFTGVNPGKQDIDEETAIKTGEFAYSLTRKNKRLLPAKNSLGLDALTPGMVNAFHDAFENPVTRPAPLHWAVELTTLSAELTHCRESKIHTYPRKMSECPWCTFKFKANILYFLDDSYLKAPPELGNIQQFINGFKLDGLPIKPLHANYHNANLQARPIDLRFYYYKYANLAGLATIFIAAVAAMLSLNFALVIPGLILLFLFWSFSPFKKKLNQELASRQLTYETLNSNYLALIKKHNNAKDLVGYNQSAGKLVASIENYKNLPAEFSKTKKEIEEKHYRIKYIQFLNQFDIQQHPIKAFGPAKKSLMYKAGIKTAADINKLLQVKIPGIGPKNEQILFDWQRQMGAGFTYTPETAAIEHDISLAAKAIVNKRHQLEDEIKREYKNLHVLKVNVQSSVSLLERQYNDLAPKVYAAELDLEAFKKLAK